MAGRSNKASEMASRYKIKVPDEEVYWAVQEELSAHNIKVFVASEKRLLFSTGSIAQNVISILREYGATVTEDFQYDLEARRPA
jgi:hypothetical protein